MRTIKLEHKEIETIKIALQFVFDKKLEYIKNNRSILTDSEKNATLANANRYFDTINCFDGDRDV